MATAVIKPGRPAVTEVRIIEPATPEAVVLTMSRREAETLAIIFRHIGGPPNTTRRGDVNRMADAIRLAGVAAPMLPATQDGKPIESTSPWFSNQDAGMYFTR